MTCSRKITPRIILGPRILPKYKTMKDIMAMVTMAANKVLSRLNIAQTVAQTRRM